MAGLKRSSSKPLRVFQRLTTIPKTPKNVAATITQARHQRQVPAGKNNRAAIPAVLTIMLEAALKADGPFVAARVGSEFVATDTGTSEPLPLRSAQVLSAGGDLCRIIAQFCA